MIEIRIHGRGGQGPKTAAEVIAEAAFYGSKYKGAQSFPLYGAERAGAPVVGSVRLDIERVLVRDNIENPDIIMVLDKGLLDEQMKRLVDVTSGLGENGLLIINSDHDLGIETLATVRYVDATKIAMETIGKPIFNTAMLGAFVKLTDIVTLEALYEVVRERFAGNDKIINANIEAIRRCYEETKIDGYKFSEPDSSIVTEDEVPDVSGGLKEENLEELDWDDFFVIQDPGNSERNNSTGLWGLKIPVADENCVGCGRCEIFCPDAAIRVLKDGGIEVNTDICKGCMICVQECKVGALKEVNKS